MRFDVAMFDCRGCERLRVMRDSRVIEGQRYCHRCVPKLLALIAGADIGRAGRSLDSMRKQPAAAPERQPARLPSAMEAQDRRLEDELRKRGLL